MSDLIPSDAVKAIQDSVVPVALTVGDGEYSSKSIHLPPHESTADTLKVHTLDGVIQYCDYALGAATVESAEARTLIVQVVNPTTVSVMSPLFGRRSQRHVYATADCSPVIGAGFKFGQYLGLETFIVSLQSQFKSSEVTAGILQVVGNLKDEAVKTYVDDGTSQVVTAKIGLTSPPQNVLLPNPVILRPYRTFPEVEQPSSPFILRMQSGKEGPQVALFEADGGKWKLDAIASIRDYLVNALPEGVTVIA